MLAGERVVEKSICHRVTLDLFHWQGHLLDGIRVTLALKWVVWDTCSRSFVLFFFFFGLVWVSCLFCRVLVPVLQVSGNFSNPPRVLDLDDRQGLIASSAVQ